MLPLMYIYELNNLMFLYKIQQLTSTSVSTSHLPAAILDRVKFVHLKTKSALYHLFYFNHFARLWNYTPVPALLATFIQVRQAVCTYCVHVTSAQDGPSQLISTLTLGANTRC